MARCFRQRGQARPGAIKVRRKVQDLWRTVWNTGRLADGFRDSYEALGGKQPRERPQRPLQNMFTLSRRPLARLFAKVRIAPIGVAIGILLFVAVGLRIWRLGTIPGMNADEAQYGIYALQFLRGEPFPLTTNTGNPLNLFFFVLQVGCHWLFEPSFALIRVPAVVSGLGALLINYLFAARLVNRRMATISTVLLAVLPINVAYSRFGWDSSQSLAATLCVVYAALGMATDVAHRGRWRLLAVLSSAAAVLVHPTNVFVLPIVGLSLIWPERQRWLGWIDPRRIQPKWLFVWLAGVSSLLLAVAAFRSRAQIGSGGLPTPTDWIAFAKNYVQLLSGVTVHRYIAGSYQSDSWATWMGDWQPIDIVFVLAGLGLLFCWFRTRGERSAATGFLSVAWLASGVCFFLIAGPSAITPHWERYGLCLIAPAALFASCLLTDFLTVARPWYRAICVGTCLSLAAVALGTVYIDYFLVFQRSGGESHRAFRTTRREPKVEAFDLIARSVPNGAGATIVSDDWWSYWPLRYLAMDQANIRVCRSAEMGEANEFANACDCGDVWFVEFRDSASYHDARARIADAGFAVCERNVLDRRGRRILSLMQPITSTNQMPLTRRTATQATTSSTE